MAIIAIPFTLIVAFSYCLMSDDGCANSMLSESKSLDGRYKAIIFERSCGATTGFSTQVSVFPVNAKPSTSGGNVLVVDTDHGAAPSGKGGGPTVNATWLSERDLQLSYHPNARVFAAVTQVESVRVKHIRAVEDGS